MATGGLYGSSTANVSVSSGAESNGLYGNNTNFGGTYFEWFIFKESATQPATPTGGSWSFVTNTGTPPIGWTLQPPTAPTNQVWVSIALVNSRSTATLTWSTPGLFGVVPAFTFPTPVTGAPGSNAAVVNTGTATNPILTFTIPRGDVGATGPTGATGPQGSKGDTGATGAGVATGGTTGQVLTKVSGTNYDTNWTTPTTGTVTSVAATAGTGISVTGSPITSSGTLNITNTAPDQTVVLTAGTGISTSGTYPNFTITNTSPSSGGTVTSVTGTAPVVSSGGNTPAISLTTSGANSVVVRDSNQNIAVNSVSEAFINVAAAGTTTVLTASSAPNYVVTGSGGQTYQLPNATTLANGVNFTFNNNQSSGAISVNNNSGTLIVSVPSGSFVDVSLLSNATAAGSWDTHFQAPSNVSWSTNTLSYAGSITSATWNGTAVAINRGGTGASTKATAFNALSPMSAAGDVIYGGTSGAGTALAIGTAGQVLTVNSGATAPQWSTPTTGTVTSVGGTGTVNGITLTGTVTTTGNLTLGGTLDLSSPPAIGGTTPSTGTFTTVTSTIATGTAPFTVASTTAVTNLSIGGNAGTVTNGVYTTDTGTVTNTMLAGSIANSKLSNSAITFGSTSQALGSTVSGISGITIDNGAVGATTASTGKFTTLTSTGTATLANGSTTYVQAIGDASYPGVYAAGGTNTPLVLQPLGTGALQAQKTDSTATGGNARGANAVDWQTSRASASQVASGSTSFIGSGRNNTASGQDSSIVAGYQNISSSLQSVVVGGAGNQATAPYSFIGGGNSNIVPRDYSSIVGGNGNGSSSTIGYFNFIGGGQSNSGTATAAVTTQSATMNGTTAVTLSGSNANIKVGQMITGTSITFPNTYVAAISGTSLTLSQVASGSSTSTLSFYTPHGVVVGGGNNQATGSYSFIGGGGDAGTAANRNSASGDWSVVAGGTKNIASGNGAFIGSGNYGGGTNTASGQNSFIGSGYANTNSGISSVILAGHDNNVNSNNASILSGVYGYTRGVTACAIFSSSAPFASSVGVTQSGIYVLGTQTTDATATVLRIDGGGAGTTNQVILPNNSAYYFRGEVVAGVTGAGDTKGWSIEGVIKRGAGVGTTALVGTPTVTSLYADTGAATWTVTALADTTNGGLKITVTGQASTTIRWVCSIRTAEMTF